MLLQPCVDCGEISERNRCQEHRPQPAPKNRTNHVAYANRSRWKNLSKRLRKMSPFCEKCGTHDDLTVDHIVRVTDRPEWAYEIDNCRVLCRRCNSRISTVCTDPSVEQEIEEKIRARRARRGGEKTQTKALVRPRVKAESELVKTSTTKEEA